MLKLASSFQISLGRISDMSTLANIFLILIITVIFCYCTVIMHLTNFTIATAVFNYYTVDMQKARRHFTPKLMTMKVRRQPARPPAPVTSTTNKTSEVKTKTKSIRNSKPPAVARSGSVTERGSAVVSGSSLILGGRGSSLLPGPADVEEMKNLMTAPVAESESRLFHTAQTIAQQVVCLQLRLSE